MFRFSSTILEVKCSRFSLL